MFRPTITCCFATASTSAAAKMNANAKLKAFRQITQSRVSARRFEPNVAVPDNVWRDVLRMTLVSSSSGLDEIKEENIMHVFFLQSIFSR